MKVDSAVMEPIPLPSPIHYELLLQLLERQTKSAAIQNPALRDQVNQLIMTLRKAAAQQRHLEETCKSNQISFDFRWSLNHHNVEQVSATDDLIDESNPDKTRD